MNRKFRYAEPNEDGKPIVVIVTEEEIVETYGQYWCDMMKRRDPDFVYNEADDKARILQDFCTIHWAYEVEDVQD